MGADEPKDYPMPRAERTPEHADPLRELDSMLFCGSLMCLLGGMGIGWVSHWIWTLL